MKSVLLVTLVAFARANFGVEYGAPGIGGGDIYVASHPFAKYKVHALETDAISAKGGAISAVDETTPLECFQVAEPVLTPAGLAVTDGRADHALTEIGGAGLVGEPACEVVLMEHIFANSYGSPFVGRSWELPFRKGCMELTNPTSSEKATTRPRIAILTMWSSTLRCS